MRGRFRKNFSPNPTFPDFAEGCGSENFFPHKIVKIGNLGEIFFKNGPSWFYSISTPHLEYARKKNFSKIINYGKSYRHFSKTLPNRATYFGGAKLGYTSTLKNILYSFK